MTTACSTDSRQAGRTCNLPSLIFIRPQPTVLFVAQVPVVVMTAGVKKEKKKKTIKLRGRQVHILQYQPLSSPFKAVLCPLWHTVWSWSEDDPSSPESKQHFHLRYTELKEPTNLLLSLIYVCGHVENLQVTIFSMSNDAQLLGKNMYYTTRVN